MGNAAKSDTEQLAASVRAALTDSRPVREVTMFGGIGFMLNGNLLVAASPRGLLVRLGKARSSAALAKAGTRPMIMRGRAMEDYIYVDPSVLDRQAISAWVALAAEFVSALPRKVASKRAMPATKRVRTQPRRRSS